MPRQSNLNLQPVAKRRQPCGSDLLAKRKKVELQAKKDAERASLFFKKRADSSTSPMTEPPATTLPLSSSNSVLQQSSQSNHVIPSGCSTSVTTPTNHYANTLDEVHSNVVPVSNNELKASVEHAQSADKLESDVDGDSFDISDASTWTFPMLPSQALLLQEQDPVQIFLSDYPKTGKAAFNPRNFQDKNGRNRSWLLYSKRTDSLFCFCCSVFPTNTSNRISPWTNFGIGNKGFADFRHQVRGIESHEISDFHYQSIVNWNDHKKRVQERKCINQVAKDNLQSEISFWKKVLRGLLDAILFLAKNNLAFVGSTTQIGEPGCGNFLSLVELLSKYYQPLSVHVKRINSNQVRTSYMSPAIQNEFIEITSQSVRNTILASVKTRKYYSIMFDATPDVSHMEQISYVIRSVDINEGGCCVEENFLGFLHFDLKTGEDISKLIVDQLKNDGLEIQNCRGQGYDNGSNMSWAYKGVQARIREINPKAIFVPCAAHSLNLVGQNAAAKILPAKLILGQIQSLYNFFSGSPLRWNTMKNLVGKTLKCQSSTRWSSKADAVSALVDNFEQVCEALVELTNSDTSNGQTVVEANSLLVMVKNFKFVFGSVTWKLILNRINLCNKMLQNKECTLDEALKHLEGLVLWLEDFKKTGFGIARSEASKLALKCDISEESGFDTRISRGRKPARFLDGTEDSSDEKTGLERFKMNFFDKVMVTLIKDFGARFQTIKSTKGSFEFLWGHKLDLFSNEDLAGAARALAENYETDLDHSAFIKEIGHLKSAVTPFLELKPLDNISPLEILNLLTKHKLNQQFPNTVTALQIFLTMPVTVATNERTFSKLKIIKNHLRSTMGQQRLSNLSILSIEHKTVKNINFDRVIKRFASKKCRRVSI